MATGDQNATPVQNNKNGLDEREIRQESGKAAQRAQAAKTRAYELRQAAHGAADNDERQKILEEAIDKEIEAESFGKTAKYMRTGTFQGMAVGTGIGVVPGVTLGTLTGTLVGGVTSAITGGLGAGIGALTGALHGPFWNMGKMVGKGVRKVTGDLPGWAATDEQKRTLETMIGHIKEQDMPDDQELERMRQEGGADEWWNSMYESGRSYLPSMPSWMKSKKQQQEKAQTGTGQQQRGKPQQAKPQKPPSTFQPPKQGVASPFYRNTNPATQKAGHDVARRLRDRDAEQAESQENRPPPASKEDIAKDDGQQDTKPKPETVPRPQAQPRGKPRKLENRSGNENVTSSNHPSGSDRKPRKLERRS